MINNATPFNILANTLSVGDALCQDDGTSATVTAIEPLTGPEGQVRLWIFTDIGDRVVAADSTIAIAA